MATYNNPNDIPIDVVPDVSQQMLNSQNQYVSQYQSAHPYQPFAGGTPTLGTNQLTETKRATDLENAYKAQALAETVRQANLDNAYKQQSLAETAREANLDNAYKTGSLNENIRADTLDNAYKMGSLGNSLQAAANKYAANSAKSASATTRDNFINVLRTGAIKYDNYNFKGAYDKANAHGAFNGVSAADMKAILNEVSKLSSKSGGTGVQSHVK